MNITRAIKGLDGFSFEPSQFWRGNVTMRHADKRFSLAHGSPYWLAKRFDRIVRSNRVASDPTP